MNMEMMSQIANPLLSWYDANARILPWRSEPSPYNVWISEIMLQQTRVEAGRAYFIKWIEALPDVEALANVSESKLMKLWEGLGYYNRARNLKKAAGIVMEQYSGILPSTYEELLSLPGIGPYTAGAIGSIAFQLRIPAVDGNVLRVMTRLGADPSDIAQEKVKKKYRELLFSIIPAERPGDFNQALMELGATVCIPNGAPKCGVCPLETICLAKAAEETGEYPVKKVKNGRKIVERTIFVLQNEKQTAFRRRPSKGLLAGLWELPGVDEKLDADQAGRILENWGFRVKRMETLPAARHVFSHIEWNMTGYLVEIDTFAVSEERPGWLWADQKMLFAAIALPSAFNAYRQYLR